MTRPINASTANLLDDAIVKLILLADLTLAGQTVRLTSAARNVVWNGNTYVGNSWLLPLDGVEETTDTGNLGFQLSLSSVDVTTLSVILNNPNRGEPATLWIAALSDAATPAIVGAPVLIYKGLIDSCEIEDKLEEPSVVINLENDLAKFDTSQNFRFTTESQSVLFPGDLGFQYVPQLETWSGFWGKSERPSWLKKKKQTKKS
jgi:hypothetical protein